VCWWPSPLQGQTKKTVSKQPCTFFSAPPFANPHVHIMDASHFKHVIKQYIKCRGTALYKTHTLETPDTLCNGAIRVSGLEHKDIYCSYVVASALMILVLPNMQSHNRVTIAIAKDVESHVHCRTRAQGFKSPTADHKCPGSSPLIFPLNSCWTNWHWRGVCSSTLVFLFQYYFHNIPHTHSSITGIDNGPVSSHTLAENWV
jgi:hypothetical protein